MNFLNTFNTQNVVHSHDHGCNPAIQVENKAKCDEVDTDNKATINIDNSLPNDHQSHVHVHCYDYKEIISPFKCAENNCPRHHSNILQSSTSLAESDSNSNKREQEHQSKRMFI